MAPNNPPKAKPSEHLFTKDQVLAIIDMAKKTNGVVTRDMIVGLLTGSTSEVSVGPTVSAPRKATSRRRRPSQDGNRINADCPINGCEAHLTWVPGALSHFKGTHKLGKKAAHTKVDSLRAVEV